MGTKSDRPAEDRRGFFGLMAGGACLGLLMAVMTTRQGTSGLAVGLSAPTPIPDRVAVGAPAPDFTGITPSGEAISLSSLRGSPVALNFWASWCIPCREEMPELQSASNRYDDLGLVILGVNAGESGAVVEAFMNELDLTFAVVLDEDGTIVDLYQIRAFPTTIWIDASGTVRAEHLGPLTRDFFDRYVAELVEG